MPRVWRQGDVLIIATDETVPAEATLVPRDDGRVVLAYGEVTGHAHALLDRRVELFALSDAEFEDRFLVIAAEAALVHEEHDTITLPPGTYRVRRQREYAPEAPVQVAD